MPGHRPLRALVFDLDGTLYGADAVRRAMTIRLLSHVARSPHEGWRTLRLVRAYRRAQEELRAAGAAIGPGDQLERACRACGERSEWGARIIARWMEESPLDLVRRHRRPGLPEWLDAARAAGLRLGLFSDYPPHAKLAAMDLADRFDAVRWAQEPAIGVFKPDPRGLLATLEALGVAPREACYVGDRPEVDGEAARRAGMRAIILGRADVRADLARVVTVANGPSGREAIEDAAQPLAEVDAPAVHAPAPRGVGRDEPPVRRRLQ
jgi:HAD superfamily hydrolase (TIGR01509 family)